MSNPTPILNNINAFDATKGTTISFNIIGGTDIVRSNIVYIYDLSTNDLICTHLYISTESIHELPPNTDSSIVYASGKSSADFVNNKNYYLQIQTFTNTAGTAGGSGMSVAKTFWCLFNPALSVNTIPAAISTTSYNVGATYTTNITDATIPVTNIIQQYKFDLYTATGTLVQTSGNIIGSGEQEGTSTTYNITYNFSGLVVNNSYYVVVTTTSTEGMTVSAQSNTFTVSIDTPTVGGAIVNNNACDGYISVVSNLSDEYGGHVSGEIASFETDSVNNVSSLKVNMEPIQEGSGTPSPTNIRPIRGHSGVNAYVSPTQSADDGTKYSQEFDVSLTPTSTDKVPYTFKAVGRDVYGDRESDKIVGGTVGWNQLCNGSSVTVQSGHKYLLKKGTAWSIGASTGTAITGLTSGSDMLFDLTAMFNPTIADYIYSLEQSQAGAGVAWFRQYFPKSYYPYDPGTLRSVEGVSAHETVGFNQWDEEWVHGTYNGRTGVLVPTNDYFACKNKIPVISGATYYLKAATGIKFEILAYDHSGEFISRFKSGIADTEFVVPSNAGYITFGNTARNSLTTYNHDICINLSDPTRNGEYEPYTKHTYPLDSSLTLRGIPKLVDGKLAFDGDVYPPSGEVQRRYGVVDLGTLAWNSGTDSVNTVFFANISNLKYVTDLTVVNAICPKFRAVTKVAWSGADINSDKVFRSDNSASILYFRDLAYTDAASFKAAMSGVYLVYELATPTTETADPFTNPQVVDNRGTEAYVTTGIVPVGHDSEYLTRDVFGGTLDLVSGVWTVDRAMVTLNTANMDNSEEYPGWRSSGIRSLMGSGLNNIFNDVQTNVGRGIGVNTRGSGDTLMLLTDQYGLTQSEWKSLSMDVQMIIPLATPQTYQLTPHQIQTLVGQNNVWSDAGDVDVTFNLPISNLLVKRQDASDVSGNWLTLYSQPITQASDMDFTFIDFLNQYGKTYKYALVPLLTQTQSGVEVEVEGGYTVSDEVQSIFDGVFIADSTGSQKCKANVGYGNVDMNQTVGTITPIGAKYPVVITNSKNQYHNGSISGTIVPDDYYFNGNLSRIDMVNKRDELEQFLTNKRAKIIKDWNSNIWLVMILDNVSCTFNNNYGMGIVNFSTNWVEVGDPTNQQDLQATGLINVGGV